MSGVSNTENNTVNAVDTYAGVEFYEQLSRKNGKPTGSIVVVNPAVRNGTSLLTIARVPGQIVGKDALPVSSWASPTYLASYCRKVSEQVARKIDGEMMTFIDKHHRSAEFRTMYAIEIRKASATTLQRAEDTINGRANRGATCSDTFHAIYG